MHLTVTREDYFEAALELLATKGATSLKIAPLCKGLRITTGSFYGYFGSFDGFVAELLAHWELLHSARISEVRPGETASDDRRRLLKDLTAQVPFRAEVSMRAWAHTNQRVAEAQRRIDRLRTEALAAALRPQVGSDEDADRLAVIGMTIFIGLQQWRSHSQQTYFDALFDEYELLVARRVAARLAEDDDSGLGRPA
ncbi:TetR/AcrR family transcriptional regulator [Antrihabitans sp. YC2-6]|uniref:TetR/AcrR family transcriptional regulator n=1 Tax=Antrihabitans sp. YC2-6 TaxID=2799498 RepID=UPI0018F4CAEA|nr:TetR/AcrR family transcriptional regulator [Antrihabitans sp. YC2-6]MBJ8343880.1 TetR/AcrR family transcriptional regulator [Antrihabitans sp. YC2-6]